MKSRKVISMFAATAVLCGTFGAYSGIAASAAATYDDYSLYAASDGVYYVDANGDAITLSQGDTVLIDSYYDLCYMSTYVAANDSAGITWKLENDIVASNYTFEYDSDSGCVLAYNADGEHEFCIGTGLAGDVVNNDETTDFGSLYTAETANGIIDFYYEDVYIPFADYDFVSIGTSEMPFKGYFDGNSCTISGLYDVPGLFNETYCAEIYDLTIANSYFIADGIENNAAGSVAANAMFTELSFCNAVDCYVGADGHSNVGGLVGEFCAFDNSVNVVDSDGVEKTELDIEFCQVYGNSAVNSYGGLGYYIGGIAGYSYTEGRYPLNFSDCFTKCRIYSDNAATGVISGNAGFMHNFNRCLFAGLVSSDAAMAYSGAYAYDCYQLEGNPAYVYGNMYTFTDVTASDIADGTVTDLLESARVAADATGGMWWQDVENGGMPEIIKQHDVCTEYVNGICKYCGNFENPGTTTIFGVTTYNIGNYGQLCAFAEIVNTADDSSKINATLTNDIVAVEGYNWTPIVGFDGNFDGNNHTILGLNVNIDTYYGGLFASINNNGSVSNVGIVDSNIVASDYAGALAGTSSGKIYNCYAYNCSVAADGENFAGLIGSIAGGRVDSVYSDSTLGVIGDVTAGTITGCYHLDESADYGTYVTTEQLNNGYVAYMLWNNCVEQDLNSTWGQDLSVDDSVPVFNASYQVYCNGTSFDNIMPSEHDPVDVVAITDGKHHSYHCNHCNLDIVNEECTYSDGFCTICGNFNVNADYIVFENAGTYTLQTPSEISGGAKNIGWIDENENLYRCNDTVTVESGARFTKVTLYLDTFAASARLNADSTGIKFATQFELTGADYDTIDVSCGTLIAPTDRTVEFTYDYFVDNGYITMSYEDDENIFTAVEANGYTYENTYFGSIVNLYPFNYGREFTGCGYAVVTYADGTSEYIYAQNRTSRSVYQLAALAYGDRTTEADETYINETTALDGTVHYSLYNDDELAILKSFIDGVVDLSIDKTTASASVNIPESIVNFYERPYTLVSDFENGLFTISGDDWHSYVEFTKNNETLYARRTILINGQRIIPSDTTFFIIPETYSDSVSNILEIQLNY